MVFFYTLRYFFDYRRVRLLLLSWVRFLVLAVFNEFICYYQFRLVIFSSSCLIRRSFDFNSIFNASFSNMGSWLSSAVMSFSRSEFIGPKLCVDSIFPFILQSGQFFCAGAVQPNSSSQVLQKIVVPLFGSESRLRLFGSGGLFSKTLLLLCIFDRVENTRWLGKDEICTLA